VNAIGEGKRGGFKVLPPSATQALHLARADEHATVAGRTVAIARAVADSACFLSALVLAQPSPRAVIGFG
jgi:hypothetical protein